MLPGNSIYFGILLVLLISASALSWIFKLHVFRTRWHLLTYLGLTLVWGVLWDSFSVWQQIWIFPSGGTLGVTLGNLPLEEYLFFIIVPYFGVVLYLLTGRLTDS